MSTPNWIAIAKAAQVAARECIDLCRRGHPGAHFIQRSVEIIAADSDGERIGDPLEYLTVKELSGKQLARIVKDHAPAQYHSITVQGGIDAYDSFKDFMDHPGDYDPMVDCWDVSTLDILPSASERIPNDQTVKGPKHLTVSQRIDQYTVQQQRAGGLS